MEKKYETLSDFTDLLRLSLFAESILLLLFCTIPITYDLRLVLLFFLYPVLFYLSIRLIPLFPIFLFTQLILLFSPFLLTVKLTSRIICIIFVLILFCTNFYFWFSESRQYTISFSQIVVFVIFATDLYPYLKQKKAISTAICLCGIVFYCLGYLLIYIQNTKHIPIQREDQGYAPSKVIKNAYVKIVRKLTLSFFVISLLSFLPDCYYYIQSFFSFMKELLRRFLTFLASLSKPSSSDQNEPVPEKTMDFNLQEMFPDTNSTPVIVKVIEAVISILILFLLLYLLYRLLKSVIKTIRLHSRKSSRDVLLENDFSPTETKEYLSANTTRHHPLSLAFSRNVNTVIRKKYRNTINASQKKGYQIVTSHTPNERESDMLTKKNENLSVLTSLYNEARYSKHPLDTEDLNRLKRNR